MTVLRAALFVTFLLVVGYGVAEGAGPLGRALLEHLDGTEPVAGQQRVRRSPIGGEDYVDDGGDDPEGRTLHKLKRKLKPHKFGHHYGGLLGNPYPAFGGHGGYPGSGCRKLHGCGGGHGWHKPHHGIGGAFAGPSPPAYGGWNPGYGGGGGWNRPNAHSQFGTWNLGPYQASFGLAHAG